MRLIRRQRRAAADPRSRIYECICCAKRRRRRYAFICNATTQRRHIKEILKYELANCKLASRVYLLIYICKTMNNKIPIAQSVTRVRD